MNNSIRTDTDASVLRRILDNSNTKLRESLLRMSSGLKVLSAKDDACGVAISAKTRVSLDGLDIANNNLQTGIAMFNVASSALKNAEDILLELRSMSLQTLNTSCGEEVRKAFQERADVLTEELERIQQSTKFNDVNLFNNQKDKVNQPAQNTNLNGNENNENVVSPQQPQNVSPSPSLNMSPNPSLNTTLSSGNRNLNSVNAINNISLPGNSTEDIEPIDISDDSGPNLNLNLTSVTPKSLGGSMRLLGATPQDTGIVADNEVNDGVYITGAFDFAKNETYRINIDGITYEVTNRNSTDATISYSKEIETGKVTFTCNYFTITGISDTDYDIVINGQYNYIYGGNNKNTFTPYDLTWSKNNKFYSNDGDDVFNIIGYGNYYYGMGGNDTFNINSGGSQYNYCYGGEGNDTFNHSKNGTEYYYGEAGNDTFNINGNNGSYYGGDGNDTFNLTKGSSCYLYGQNGDDNFTIAAGCSSTTVDGGAGTNTMVNNGTNTSSVNIAGDNSYTIDFAKNEQKDVVINVDGQNITYTVKNRTSAQKLTVQINKDKDNRIEFRGSNFTITGQSDVAHNVGLMSSSIYFYGGDLDDNVYLGSSSQIVDTGNGNDTVTNVSSYNSIFTGNGNDKVYTNSYGDIQTGDGNDEVIYRSGYSYNHIDLGNGNDTVRGENTNGTTNNNRAYTSSAIFGGEGTDTFQLTGASANASINYIKDGFDTSKFSTFEIGASETKNLVIHTNSGDYTYSIKNRIAHDKTIHYYYDSVEDKIIFSGGNIDIRGEADKVHNIELYSSTYTYFYGGNMNDNITMMGGYNNYIYGGKGNDVLNSSTSAPYSRLYGEDGEDTIYLNSTSGSVYGGNDNDTIYVNNTSCQACDGGVGDDSYYIAKTTSSIDNYGNNVYYVDSDSITLSAGAGNDTFYITSNDNNIAGGGGDDYFIVSGTGNNIDGGTGTNYIVDNGEGNVKPNTDVDPNAGALVFSYLNEQHSFSIDDKMYIVKNCTETASGTANNNVSYTYNANTGEIFFTGSNLTITACDGISHNIRIEGDNNTVQGGNMSDTIIVNRGTNNLIKGNAGNDNITLASENNAAQGGSGDDNITVNASTSKTIDAGDGNDTLYLNANNNSDVKLGSGNDTVRSTTGSSGNTIELNSGNNDLLLNGNSNTVTAGSGNNRISAVGNNNNISAGSGSNTIGVNGNSNTLEARGNSTFNAQGDNNSFNLSGNNNTINSRGANGEVTSIGNNNINLTGNESNINSIGNSTINVKGNDSSVTSIGNCTITTEGLNVNLNSIGKSTITQTGDDANIEAENGKITLSGSNASLSAKGANLYVYGSNNDINNISSREVNVSVEIEGSNNNLTAENTSDNIKLNGDNNTLSLNNYNDTVELVGNNNNISESDGSNRIRLRGNNNNVQGGAGADSFRVSSGTDNVFEGGEETQRNTIYNLGENTTYNNCLDITPKPLNVCIQVGSDKEEEIIQTIQFILGDFWIDVSSVESSKESLGRIDELIDHIHHQQSSIGASLNRFEQILNLNQNKIENLNLKKSIIEDCDMAEESVKFALNNIRQNIQTSLWSQMGSLRRDSIMGLINGAIAYKF